MPELLINQELRHYWQRGFLSTLRQPLSFTFYHSPYNYIMKIKIHISVKCLIFLHLFAGISSCSKEADSSDSVQLTLSTYQIQTPLGGGEQSVSVTSGKDWTASPLQDWIEVNPSSGNAGTSKLTIKIQENESASQRTGKISIQSGSTIKNISVTQEPQKALLLPASFCKLSYDGAIMAPTDNDGAIYELKNEQVEWIELKNTKDDSQLMSIYPNESGTDRCGIICYRKKGTNSWNELLIAQTSNDDKNGFLSLTHLTVNGIRTTIDRANGKYYIPVDMDAGIPSTVKVEFNGLGVDFIRISDKKIRSGEDVFLSDLKANRSMTIDVCNELVTEPNTCELIVTGIPIIEITAPEGIVDEPKRPCEIVLTDPKGRTNGSEIRFESYGGIEIRGAGSQRYDKKAYSFKLKDRTTDENLDAKLLGMREDQSWILDAMWLDCSKMRNRVCFDIWNDFHTLYYTDREPKAISATHGYPVEMFLDGTYHGLYILSDRIDRKQLKLKKKGGYLYKGGEWTDECKLQGITSPYDNSRLEWKGFDAEYPDEVGEADFKYLSDLIQFFSSASKEEFETHLEERLDIHSLIDYFIFINLLMAYDNTGRNIFWAIYNIKETEGTRFLILPWDLDGTLGRTWDAVKLDPEKGLGFDNGLTLRNDGNLKYFRPFERIMDENPNNIKQRIYERFMEVKDKALSPENMAAKVDYYKRQIVESGAIERDWQKWSGKWMYGYAAPDEEAEYMKKWYTARLKYLEKVFQSL